MSIEDDTKQEPELMDKVLEFLSETMKDTNWAPPEGGVMVDALVVMMYAHPDRSYGSCWMSAGSVEQAEGMARKVLRSLDASVVANGVARATNDDS